MEFRNGEREGVLSPSRRKLSEATSVKAQKIECVNETIKASVCRHTLDNGPSQHLLKQLGNVITSRQLGYIDISPRGFAFRDENRAESREQPRKRSFKSRSSTSKFSRDPHGRGFHISNLAQLRSGCANVAYQHARAYRERFTFARPLICGEPAAGEGAPSNGRLIAPRVARDGNGHPRLPCSRCSRCIFSRRRTSRGGAACPHREDRRPPPHPPARRSTRLRLPITRTGMSRSVGLGGATARCNFQPKCILRPRGCFPAWERAEGGGGKGALHARARDFRNRVKCGFPRQA